MKKFIVGLLISAITPATALAQKLTVVKATEQHWSGGVVGSGGVNYYFMLKSNGSKITLDSIYVDDLGFSLIPIRKPGGNLTIDSSNHTYDIRVGQSYRRHPGFGDMNMPVTEDTTKPAPVRHFKGKALVVYHYKRKKGFFPISEIALLPALAYP